ncbi:MAG: radical SAM family heme chaperone HemW [Hyphomicrobiaceae bacterium]
MQHEADVGFGVYVHWPFCAAKCPYCDFNSHVRHGGVDEASYVAALVRELTTLADGLGGRQVTSIFFGGGTPSLMTPAAVGALLDAVAGLWPLAPACEITLEANPSSVEAGRFQGYRAAGVNRVSLGVQAIDEAALRALGRLHDLPEARRALETAHRTFERVSFDLIYARPGQTPEAWARELDEALTFGTDHLSLYQLTIEEGTPFATLHRAGRLVTPDPDVACALYEITQERTGAAGLPAYEISNHARPGQESAHNLLYWRYGGYLGVGPGAHSRLPLPCGSGRRALVTERNPERWLAHVRAHGHGVVESETLGAAEMADEMLLMGLRLAEGLDLGRLARITGRAPREDAVSELERLGFVERQPDGRRIRASERGRIVLNEIVLSLSGAFCEVGVGDLN